MITSILNSCSKFKPSKPFVMMAQKYALTFEIGFSMPVANILDFLKVLELQGSIFLDWRPDVFAVSRIFHRLKLVYAGHVPMERRRLVYSYLNAHYFCLDLRGAM